MVTLGKSNYEKFYSYTFKKEGFCRREKVKMKFEKLPNIIIPRVHMKVKAQIKMGVCVFIGITRLTSAGKT